MQTIFDQIKKLKGKLGPLGGTFITGSQLIGTFQEVFQNPMHRWIGWIVALCFFALPFLIRRRKRSILYGQDGKNLDHKEKYTIVNLIGTTLLLAILVTDVGLTLSKQPIVFSRIEEFEGTLFGYTDSYEGNPLVSTELRNIYSAVSQSDYRLSPYSGVSGDVMLQRAKGFGHVLIHRFVVKVEKFTELPRFECNVSGVELADSLEASFLITKQSTKLPWIYSANHVRLRSGSIEQATNRPILLTDDRPLSIRFWLNAENPGIYWIRCFVIVGVGISREKEIELTSRAIPVAYIPYEPISNQGQDLSEPEIAQEIERLKVLLHSLKNGSTVVVPNRDSWDKDFEIKDLEDRIKYLNEKERVLAPSAPDVDD